MKNVLKFVASGILASLVTSILILMLSVFNKNISLDIESLFENMLICSGLGAILDISNTILKTLFRNHLFWLNLVFSLLLTCIYSYFIFIQTPDAGFQGAWVLQILTGIVFYILILLVKAFLDKVFRPNLTSV